MNGMITRRGFVSGALLASAGALVPSAFAAKKVKKRKVQIGHTGIAWSGRQTEDAIASISSLGFYWFETFGNTLM